MADNYSNRIERLRVRRKGVNEIYAMDEALASRQVLLEKSAQQGNWENRASGKSATKYALGAMQEVDPVYTRVSIDTAERIENQLADRLKRKDITTSFRLQGSVPLNIHIKGVSDVDILAIDEQIFMSDRNGIKNHTYTPSDKTSVDVILALRIEIEDSLISAFPAATVHTDNAKSVKITGGSLARDVDVVPAVWWNNVKYQASDRETDRGVTILNKKTSECINNTPFFHIELITDRCGRTFGGLRKSIRLLKNIKADSEAEGNKIGLSSFDIASIMYHADVNNLGQGRFYELAILGETQRWLDWLWNNYEQAKNLYVPDQTRKIFDNNDKKAELGKLSHEVDKLVLAVAHEIAGISGSNEVNESIRNYVSKSAF